MQGSKTKDWAAALRRAVHRESAGKGSPKWLEVIAMRCVQEAADGNAQAMQEIGNRLDGRPHQTTDVNATGSLSVTVVSDFADTK